MRATPSKRNFQLVLKTLTLALSLISSACAAATLPVDTGAPRAEEAPYPVVLAPNDERREKALANWGALTTSEPAAAVAPELRPVTATVEGIPAELGAPLRLPKVIMDSSGNTDEEQRESLRRFISSAAPLLGIEPRELSLISITDAGVEAGARRATYRQRPFPHPLRNGFGTIEITFTPDLRVVALSSTAIPDAERLRRALVAVNVRLDERQAIEALLNKPLATPITAASATGGVQQQARTLTSTEGVAARQLVVFPIQTDDETTIRLHIAWEIDAGTPDRLLAYVDAVTGELLGTARET